MMRIKVKEDTENTGNKEVIEIKKEGAKTPADDLFDPLQSLVLEYLGDKNHLDDKEHLSDEKNHQGDDKNHLSDEMSRHNDAKDHLGDGDEQTDIQKKNPSHPNSYKYQPQLTLFGNLTSLYTTQIANNLLWHIDVDKTLAFAKANPACLLIPVEVKDPHGQRVRGTPLQILAAAGDRNPRKMKAGEKDYGLVERLRSCFPEGSEEFEKQLTDWFSQDVDKAETKKTMGPYVEAIKTLCQEIINSKEIPKDPPIDFEKLLELPIVEKFRTALTPDPNHIVTSGLLFDLQIFHDFFDIWEANVNNDQVADQSRPNLGDWFSIKSYLFAAIVFPSLQARTQRIDLEIFKKGYWNVVEFGHTPDLIDFSAGIPADLIGLGREFYFDLDGGKLSRSQGWEFRDACGVWVVCSNEMRSTHVVFAVPFQKLYHTKTSSMHLCTTSQIINRFCD